MKWFKRILLAVVAFLVLAQLVRPDLTNPPIDPANVLQTPAHVQPILDRSCNDCHSSRTTWPWYSQVAPVSWWLADHVKEARRELNFSEFETYSAKKKAKKFEEICEQVKEGEMPLKAYVPLHPETKLSEADRETLCRWSEAERLRVIPGASGS